MLKMRIIVGDEKENNLCRSVCRPLPAAAPDRVYKCARARVCVCVQGDLRERVRERKNDGWKVGGGCKRGDGGNDKKKIK